MEIQGALQLVSLFEETEQENHGINSKIDADQGEF